MMPTKTEELTGVFQREFFRRDTFFMGEIDRTGASANGQLLDRVAKIKGQAEEGELEPGLEYRFFGRWGRSHPKGPCFAVKTFVRAKPHTRGGVIRYLCQKQVPWIGAATATAAWNKFGADAVRILREDPEIASDAVGGSFNHGRAKAAAAVLKKLGAIEDCTIDLMGILDGRRFPKETAKRVIRAWGNRAAEIIQRNPYVLMAFRGCGFGLTDAMYLDLGLPPAKLKRQALCAWHGIASDTDGHTWFPVEVAAKAIRARIAGVECQPVKAMRLACRAGLLVARRDANGKLWIAEGKDAQHEAAIAEYIARAEATETATLWPVIEGTDADDGRPSIHQATEVNKAFRGLICILRGSPGTGKTFVAAAVAKMLLAAVGAGQIAAAAPTGKAAVRLTEALLEYGISLRATTIHSLLRVEAAPEEGGGGGWSFRHNEAEPLPFKVIIVDEASMVDASLMRSLLAARARGMHILFIGDTNQLAPVGRGAPLRDLILAGTPNGELREIRRNAGTIVRACAAIRDNKPFPIDADLTPFADPPRNLKLVPAKNGKEAADKIVDLLRWIRDKKLCDPIWDVQVVVAVNERSELSRKALNKRLQEELNGSSPGFRGSPFKLHDKVIQLKNGFLLAADTGDNGANEDRKHFVANGEQGRVYEVREKLTFVEFSNPKRKVKIPRSTGRNSDDGDAKKDDDTGAGCDLDLAYTITVHKSQGSEYLVVIVALDEYPGARRVQDRNWLYTAFSRAKRVCLPIGKRSTADAACRRQTMTGPRARKTFLVEQIEEMRKSFRIGVGVGNDVGVGDQAQAKERDREEAPIPS